MAFVDPKLASKVAGLPGVAIAVEAERDKLAAVAEGLFAAHDNPGGHKITTEDPEGTQYGRLDAFVNLEGPAPLSVEFGHWTPDHKQHVDGLHILGRMVAQATL